MYRQGLIVASSLLLGFLLLSSDHSYRTYAKPDSVADTALSPVLTYHFKGRITDNGGLRPFRIGDTIVGQFSYDLKAIDEHPDHREYGAYRSPRNAIFFEINGFRFSGAGDVVVTTGRWKHAEHFGIVAPDLNLPDGWKMDHTIRSQSYGFLLQNAPSKGVLADKSIPMHLELSRFTTTREVRLDFFHGVRFPGGGVAQRATVFATVEKLG